MQKRDDAGDGTRDLHRRLVGEDLGQQRLRHDVVADAHVPRHQLGLCDALADIRQLDFEHAHADITSRIAAPTRAGPGKYDHSCACG